MIEIYLASLIVAFNTVSVNLYDILTPQNNFLTQSIAQRRRTPQMRRGRPEQFSGQDGLILEKLVQQNQERSYYLYIPRSYQANKPMPLLLAFHGGVSQGNSMAVKTGFNEIAEREGFIVAYPNGLDRGAYGQWSDGRHLPANDSIDDVSFMKVLIKHLSKTRNIDQKRIYATGGSNGGFFTQRLACEMSEQLAAVASVAATLPQPMVSRCKPKRAIPILMINGTEDKLVPWAGGTMEIGANAQILSVPQTVAFWRSRNGCSTRNQEVRLPDTQADGTEVVKIGYFNCKSGAPVVLYQIEGGGHGWPSGQTDALLGNDSRGNTRGNRARQRLVGNTSQDINASEVIWQFLQKYSL
ncbi:MAG: prolyl oligopeptidase family serine peptidase [Pseudanabaena sp. M135S2SP2A07QC]|nr:prolyl oligopeptidase family serine peptidase [Pseudanabaena sp. M090S1SP2A07QC]MCA6505285.1 prolyl oligopeptidase family serine peptidase [Pseudanabaena sp. M172S2SP2A07QC]MCA6521690.1 prolyl oligopeptidase family serine peptidase [Pseudanabaena sp. M051S1SP2A07QC]MCA6527861.1 prolyl oligopeptidase family serine peptidase [Pseudanabaena sp. M179S2SP2A07QC]MCA6529676.1 prolyl oligopeptidase family serine peptidase [Pseudanabaena sp. M125S2SP2A07QC]MCA6532729.1 prolyl oligopeptidase family s